ncbi:hypothetical protein ACQJBY_054251 [Aegilops geniculata]
MENHLPGIASRRGAGSALLRIHTNVVALGEEFVGGEAEKAGGWEEEEEELVQQISSGGAGRGRAMAAAAFGLRVERYLSVPPGRQAHGEPRSPRYMAVFHLHLLLPTPAVPWPASPLLGCSHLLILLGSLGYSSDLSHPYLVHVVFDKMSMS